MRRSADLVQLLTRAERLLTRRLHAVLEAEGHTPDSWRVITLLADGAGHFMTELSDLSFLPPASLTRLVDHLVEENLIYRRVDDADRRRIRAHLTQRGLRLYARISRAVDESLAGLPVAPDDRERLTALLGTLVDGLDPALDPVP
jgi:DNA-binding MarR family transcriptional regulator